MGPKPDNLSFEEAAAVPEAALTALQGLRYRGQVQPGQKVLINGASGGVGMFAVQMAKSFGAEVTGVCSTRKMDMVRSIGADHVIDYTQEDFTQNEDRYKDWALLKELVEAGKVVPFIDRIFPLNEAPEALRYYGEGHARGKVVITMEENSK